MAGRHAIRTGNGSVPIGTPRYGLVQRGIHDGGDALRHLLQHWRVGQMAFEQFARPRIALIASMSMWAFAHKSCPLDLWLTLPTACSLMA
jgi:hypothetical protein